MKKIYLAAIAVLSVIPFVSKAQWTISGTNIYNSNTGNVGIGITTPAVKLDIKSDGDIISGNFKGIADFFSSGSGAPGIRLGFNSNTKAGIIAPTENAAGAPLEFWIYNHATTAFIQPMTIVDNGKVGIGTTSPGSLLHINSPAPSIQASPSSYGGTDYASYFGSLTTAVGILQLGNNGQNDIIAGNTATGGFLRFIVNNSNTFPSGANGTVAMQITSAGKVGIGTTTPDELLSVLGKIHANEVKVDLSVPGPDYVFKTDYKLPSLAEVKTYVDKNHHLAEIPSADDMAKNGLNLGDMNTKLLKKVEELTLYLIEKDKKDQEKDNLLKSQQRQIDELKSQLSIISKKR